MGKYAAGGELKPPTTAYSRGSGKHPQLMPSTPRWAVANGAGVILSVCDEEVARYETANLTLQPWIARDDEQGQKMWRVNQRIVKLIAELMRNHDSPEALVILASASDLLLRATDGMLVDGEACTLPQLELLEVTARAVHLIVEWGDSGVSVADGLSNLLKCRLSTTIRCLSHPSAHVRALSMSVLRDILNSGQINSSKLIQGEHRNGIQSPTYQCLAASIINWQADVERCIEWEAHSRRATGLTLAFLTAAAKELGCPLTC
ncbi:putative gigantea [Oryza sativa Japonica Group]|nr:putative gigantea [Oryza sativa Japonica Group]